MTVVRGRGEGPLFGKTVLVTRPVERSSRLVKLLDQRGARPVVAPTIAIAPARSAALTRALKDLVAGRFDWIALTSPSTVAMLEERIGSGRNLNAKVATIGDGTAESFRRWARREADLKPGTYTTAGLGRAFPRGEGRVLCARADIAPEGLEDVIAAKGWAPTRVDAYRTRFPRSLPKEARDALRDDEVDAITFTSASTVRGFARTAGTAVGRAKIVCIGQVTSKEARAHGLRVHAVADPHTTEGLIAALERVFRPRRPRTG